MNKVVSIKCSPDEHEQWKKAAHYASFNSWARGILNQKAGEQIKVLDEEEALKASQKLPKGQDPLLLGILVPRKKTGPDWK